MNYTIFSCRLTIDLMRTYGELYGVLVPVEQTRKFDLKKQTVTVNSYAAIPGFAFVPVEHAKEIRRKTPEAYNLKQLFTFSGNPCLITKRELDELQVRLDNEFKGTFTFKVGDKVLVHFHPLNKQGAVGEIVKFRSSGKARIKLAKLHTFVEVPQILLSKA